MNSYRVRFRRNPKLRVFICDVEACRPGTAISRALQHFDVKCNDVDVSCRLRGRDVVRDWGDPKVRSVKV